MSFDKKFLQRALLAFTAGLFLACAARISAGPEGLDTSTIPGLSSR